MVYTGSININKSYALKCFGKTRSRFNKLKFALFSFINIFLIFRVDLLILPFYLELIAVLGLFLLFFKYANKYFNTVFAKILMFIPVMISIGLLAIFVNASDDFSYITSILTILFKIGLTCFSFFLFRKLFKGQANLLLYFKSFILSCIFYECTTLLLLAIKPLYAFWIGTIVPTSYLIESGEYFYRISLKGYSGFMDIAIFAVSLFMCGYVIANNFNQKIHKNRFVYYMAYPILCFGCLLYGRVSFVTIGLSLIYTLIATKHKKFILKYYLFLLIVVLTAVLTLYLISTFSEEVNRWFLWAMDPVIALFSPDKKLISNSMASMYKLPELETFLIGDGRFKDGTQYYMGTDIGFLRAIYFYGVFGMLLNYWMMLYVIFHCVKLFKANRNLKIVLLFFGLNALIYELKGIMWDTTLTYLIFIYLLGIEQKRRRVYDNHKNAV